MLYVLNVIMNEEHSKVLMIEKKRPKWQAGKYNFIGGKVEEGEEPGLSVLRETKEECGLDTHPRYVGRIYGEGFMVMVYRSIVPDIHQAKQLTDEAIEVFELDDREEMGALTDNCVDNVMAILHICLQKEGSLYFEIVYD